MANISSRRFSTTTFANEVSQNIALMNTPSSYFTYSATVICGIPQIQLEGTVEDWVSIQSAVKELAQYDLNWWVMNLTLFINEFVNAWKGIVNQKFLSEI